MIFNEILIPQDSFTETNVTRKKIHRRKFATTFPKSFYSKFHIFAFILFFVYFYMSLKNMKDNNKTICHTKMMHKNKMLEKRMSK